MATRWPSAVTTAPGRMELVEASPPVGGDGQVLIDVRAAGIRGSELHGY